jgi:hypothetical protein
MIFFLQSHTCYKLRRQKDDALLHVSLGFSPLFSLTFKTLIVFSFRPTHLKKLFIYLTLVLVQFFCVMVSTLTLSKISQILRQSMRDCFCC